MQPSYSKPDDYVKQKASSLLGKHFDFNPPDLIDDHERTGLVVYDILSRVRNFPNKP